MRAIRIPNPANNIRTPAIMDTMERNPPGWCSAINQVDTLGAAEAVHAESIACVAGIPQELITVTIRVFAGPPPLMRTTLNS
jgi:hypothetical protein